MDGDGKMQEQQLQSDEKENENQQNKGADADEGEMRPPTKGEIAVTAVVGIIGGVVIGWPVLKVTGFAVSVAGKALMFGGMVAGKSLDAAVNYVSSVAADLVDSAMTRFHREEEDYED